MYIASRSLISSFLCNLDRFVYDLRNDPEPFLNMSINELKINLKKISPKILRVIKTNKAPIVLDKPIALTEKAYSDLDLKTIKKEQK